MEAVKTDRFQINTLEADPECGEKAGAGSEVFPALFHARRRLLLASASPRRRELLSRLGVTFGICPSPAVEPLPGAEAPDSYAMRAARAKAQAVTQLAVRESPEDPPVIIGADTVVIAPAAPPGVTSRNTCSGLLFGRILGKPADDAEALDMLLHLSGRTHQVCTACCLLWPEHGSWRSECFSDTAHVTLAPWPRDILAAYVRTGEGRDKAGSYAMQGIGAFLVSSVEGQWSTVVGLPVHDLAFRLLRGGAIGI